MRAVWRRCRRAADRASILMVEYLSSPANDLHNPSQKKEKGMSEGMEQLGSRRKSQDVTMLHATGLRECRRDLRFAAALTLFG